MRTSTPPDERRRKVPESAALDKHGGNHEDRPSAGYALHKGSEQEKCGIGCIWLPGFVVLILRAT